MTDHDVIVVGGGPAGATVAVFTARYGLDTAVYDRGPSSIARCGYLANYPGFPGGVDVETFAALLRAQLEHAGARLIEDVVERVEPADGTGPADVGEPLQVTPLEGDPLTADRVVAAARYDATYLEPLCGEAAFETVEHHGETHRQFDRDYPGDGGRTPVEGLYVASPSDAADRQAVMAAGRGARVAHAVIEDVRQAEGLRGDLRECRDWVRRRAALDEAWTGREPWREWFAERFPEDADVAETVREALREEEEVDRLLASCLSEETIDRRRREGQRRLLDHVADDLVLERATEIERARTGGAPAAEGED